MRPIAIPSLLCLSLCLTACPGDDGSEPDQAGSTSTTGGETDLPTTDPDPDSTTTDPDSTTTDPDSTTTDDPTTTGETEGDTDPPAGAHYGALVRGPLFTEDLDMAQGVHDAVAMGGEQDAMAAGDYGHDALLGTTLLGTTEDEFMGLDQWDNLEGAVAVYSDPMFAQAFGMLFGAPPNLELLERRDDWHTWGDPTAGDGGDHWFVVVRGRLAEPDLDAMQALHDGIAAMGEDAAMGLGDVAHVVWVGRQDFPEGAGQEDPQQFMAIDIWTDDANIEAFYGDPNFQRAFGMLFEAPPTIGVYHSTDWYQW